MGRITGSASIETLVRVGIEKVKLEKIEWHRKINIDL